MALCKYDKRDNKLQATEMVKFVLQHAMKAGGGVEVQLYSFFNLGARWGWATC